ncbi:PAS domain S-box protein [Paraburkholderia solisilvae]|uniref:histidine kinase n=1 Tax=Paraburkholderia solisilvae TaxID=624376 RepID=A0A6J5E3G7_9BURK|nr:PAS domain S-box protein [Paraburkholderia solisilvae]CAB3759816.1 Adaptive-response sensory-kinase SasA [Paraburkholderia solisilvae]
MTSLFQAAHRGNRWRDAWTRWMRADLFEPPSLARRLVFGWAAGFLTLGLLSWLCYRLGLDVIAAESVFLIAIVLISLVGSFVMSIGLCVVAVLYIDYYFIKPVLSFDVQYKQDMPALLTFLIASLAITGLVRHVRALGDVRSEQARLLDLTHDTVIVRDMDGVILFWNYGAEEMYGWKKRDAIGKNIHQLLKTRFPAPLDEITASLLRTGRWDGELVHTRRDGTELSIATRWSLQRNGNGRALATLETGNDITARKEAEQALRRSQATYLAEAQRLSHTGSFGWNVWSGEVVWSEQTFRIFEFDPGIVPTLELVLQRVHPDDVERFRDIIGRASTHKQDFEFEFRLVMPDGAIKHLQVVAHVMRDEPERLHYAGAVMDVTQARQSEQQLHHAQSELARVTRVTTLGELSASIAHEVGQPLAAIVTNGEACLRWLDHQPPQPDEVRAGIARMIGEGRRATEIVRRIRTLARKDTGQKTPLELNDVVNDVVSLTQREVLSHQVPLRVRLAPLLPPVLGDRVQLQQVLINLVMNGIQSMDGITGWTRELSIETGLAPGGNVTLTVRDCGAGLDPRHAERVFDAFFSTKPHGMGMGLSICRSIIDAHGGKIVALNNETHGATFQCILPPLAKSVA